MIMNTALAKVNNLIFRAQDRLSRSDGRQLNNDAFEFCAQDEEGTTSGTRMIGKF